MNYTRALILCVKAINRFRFWIHHTAALTFLLVVASFVQSFAQGGYVLQFFRDGTPLPVPDGLTNVVRIAADRNYSMALTATGEIVVWGYDFFGQQNVPQNLTNVSMIAAAPFHAVALTKDGKIVPWGSGGNAMVIPRGLTNVIQIAAGLGATFALKSNQSLVAWGDYRGIPQAVANSAIAQIKTREAHSLALSMSGQLFGWGYTDFQVPVPAGISNVVAMDCGTWHNMALDENGMFFGWDSAGFPIANPIPWEVTNIVSVAAGNGVCVALRKQGDIVLWTTDTLVRRIITTPNAIQQVAACADRFIVLTGDERPLPTPILLRREVLIGERIVMQASAGGPRPITLQWRHNGSPILNATNSELSIAHASISNTGDYSVEFKNAFGTTISSNAHLQVLPFKILSEPRDATGFLGGSASFRIDPDPAAGPFSYQWYFKGVPIPGDQSSELKLRNLSFADSGEYSVVISNSMGSIERGSNFLNVNTVAAWSAGGPVDLGPGLTNIVSCEAVHEGAGLFLSRNGTILAAGSNDLNAQDFDPQVSNAVSLSGSSYHYSATLSSGRVYSWSRYANPPTATLSNITQVSIGYGHAVALLENGTIVGWADAGFGNSSPIRYPFPKTLRNVVAVSAGFQHDLALLATGQVIAVGEDQNGATKVPLDLTNAVAISAGYGFSAALRADGTVVAWGSNQFGETNVPTGLSNVVAIAGKTSHTLALRSDGTVESWGAIGRAAIPEELTNAVAISGDYALSLAVIGEGAPFLKARLQDRTAHVGESIFINPSVAGAIPMRFQWNLNEAPIEGATNRWLEIRSAQRNQSGVYSLTARNAAGVVTAAETCVDVREVTHFTNENYLQIPSVGAADTFPSIISVAEQPGTIAYVRATLYGLNHENPDDLDIILAGPDGRSMFLMSDAGGTNDVWSATITFDDGAAMAPLNNGPLGAGTFLPSNYGIDSFSVSVPVPAPTATNLTVFNGMSPNGDWKLYVIDDANNGWGGSIEGGWSLEFETIPAQPVPQLFSAKLEGGSIKFRVQSTSGYFFDIQSSESLSENQWTTVKSAVASDFVSEITLAPPSNGHAFFRLKAHDW